MTEDDGYTVGAVARIVAFCTGLVIFVGITAYYFTSPCWPWEEPVSIAGGTFCDGERKARFDID